MIAASLDDEPWGTRQEFSVLAGLLSGLGFGMADALLGAMTPEQSTSTLFIARLIAAGCTLVALTVCRLSDASIARNSAALSIADARLRFPRPRVHSSSATKIGTFRCTSSPSICSRVWIFSGASRGWLDAFGHLGYIVAATRDSMSVAAAVVALFPCVSVLLAVLVLRERLNFVLSCGILITILSVVLLAS